eukprot:2402665-Rhodomonas_salina.1
MKTKRDRMKRERERQKDRKETDRQKDRDRDRDRERESHRRTERARERNREGEGEEEREDQVGDRAARHVFEEDGELVGDVVALGPEILDDVLVVERREKRDLLLQLHHVL